VVRDRQRRRRLARQKYERQQVRRADRDKRNRQIAIVVGVLLALIAAALITWFVLSGSDSDGEPADGGTVVPPTGGITIPKTALDPTGTPDDTGVTGSEIPETPQSSTTTSEDPEN